VIVDLVRANYATRPQQFLYFLPLPHGQGSLRPILFAIMGRGADVADVVRPLLF